MAVAMLSGLAGGCVPGEVPGECMYGDMSISCGLIRECDSQTGNVHWEYGMPKSTGNVNINVTNADGVIVGHTIATGVYVAGPRPVNTNVPVVTPTIPAVNVPATGTNTPTLGVTNTTVTNQPGSVTPNRMPTVVQQGLDYVQDESNWMTLGIGAAGLAALWIFSRGR